MSEMVLSDIVEVISGGTPSTAILDYWKNGTIDWLSINDFKNTIRYVYRAEKKITQKGLEYSSTKLLKKGDIIISARGTVGELAQIAYPMCFNQSCFGLRAKGDKVDENYLFYYLKFYVDNIKKRGVKGAIFNTINLDSFDNMQIDIELSLSNQQKIASVLSSLDAKIELNNRIISELEAMAKQLYDYWFVQFDFPNAEGKPYRSSGGKMVYNEKLKREIPEGWEVKKISSIALTSSGGTPKSTERAYYENGDIPWINSGELNNPVIIAAKNYITKKGIDNSSAKLFPSNILLIALYGATAGKISYLTIEATTNQAVCAIILKEKYFNHYIRFYIEMIYNHLVTLSSGSARDNLSQNEIKELYILIPNENIIKRFAKVADKGMSVIQNKLLENQELSTLRDWLLPMLMNGQVKIK